MSKEELIIQLNGDYKNYSIVGWDNECLINFTPGAEDTDNDSSITAIYNFDTNEMEVRIGTYENNCIIKQFKCSEAELFQLKQFITWVLS